MATIARLTAEVRALEAARDAAIVAMEKDEATITEHVDTREIEQRLQTAEQVNARVRANAQRAQLGELPLPLQDQKGFRVVDEKHPDQQGQQAQRGQVDIERSGQVLGRGEPRVYAAEVRRARQQRRDLAAPARRRRRRPRRACRPA
jgi:hypothetical protein